MWPPWEGFLPFARFSAILIGIIHPDLGGIGVLGLIFLPSRACLQLLL